jgi:hypothetical protein
MEPNKTKFYCIIISDSVGGPPSILESESLDGLKDVMYQKLLETKEGWCYFITGTRSYLSNVRQSFTLKSDNGTIEEIGSRDGLSFEANGRFTVLVPPLKN